VVSAVVLTDFTVDGVDYRKGQQITISKDQYDQWVGNNWVGPGSDPKTVTQDWVGPGSEDK
jgi:hypothetical protein